MGDADELLFLTEGDDPVPVLKPDRARGLEARRGKARQFIEEDAAARVGSAFRQKLKANASPVTCAVSLYHKHSGNHLRPHP
jgi:hypothetical protein